MSELSYDDYKKEVVRLAVLEHKKPVCTDTIKEYYECSYSIEDAVEGVLTDTVFWDGIT